MNMNSTNFINTPRGNFRVVFTSMKEAEANGCCEWFTHDGYTLVGNGTCAYAVDKPTIEGHAECAAGNGEQTADKENESRILEVFSRHFMFREYGYLIISSDTLNPIDLANIYLAFLRENFQPEYLRVCGLFSRRELQGLKEWNDSFVDKIQELEYIMCGIAPRGYYFGAVEGDGACLGYWKIEEDESNDS